MQNHYSVNESFPIVGIGVPSVRGKALKDFFQNIPDDCGMSFVIVGCDQLTVQILSEYTAMPILDVKEDMKIIQNHVFLCPKDKDVGVVRGNFYLREPLPEPRKHIDYFFSALAYDQGENAIGILFSGSANDGASGLKEIKAQFGIIMVENRGGTGLADSHIDTQVRELADFILPFEKMCDQLLIHSKWMEQRASLSSCEKLGKNSEILKDVFFLIQMHNGYDFSQYKKATIYRRIESRMRVCGIKDMKEYVRYLQQKATEVETLFKAILINVTRFFRDPEAFEILEKEVIPELLDDKPEGYNLRIWIPGCSSGEEVYSLAIIIQEGLNKARRNITLQIFATDIDEEAISTARTGLYPLSIADDIHPERLKHFFQLEDNQYRISKEIRQNIIYASHNLIKDPPFIKLDMICCRNLLIYFENSLQQKIANLFHFSLLPKGILFLGPSESFGSRTNLFTVVNSKWKLYIRRNVMSRLWPTSLPGSSLLEAKRPREDLASVPESEKSGLIHSMEKMLLENYTPACFLVNEKGDILYVNGNSRKYFELAAGETSLNIATMVKEEMRYNLRAALRQAAKTKKDLTIKDLRVMINGQQVIINLSVKPIEEPKALQGLIMVVFEEVFALPMDTAQFYNNLNSPGTVTRIDELENELQSTKIQLLQTIEEIELSYMETAASNEELHSANEELQSSNEEMETSREEIQSLYEEVVTVNNELYHKISELAHANDDMTNMLNSTEIAFIFLDSHLNIMRYTPLAPRLVNIISTDVDRPLAHLVTRLRNVDIVGEAQKVLETHSQIEMEVQTLDWVWYLMRVTPYRTSENILAGVVVSFVDISKLKALGLLNVELKDRGDYAWSIIDAIDSPLLVMDRNFKILTANLEFFRVAEMTPLETEGTSLAQFCKDRWNIDELEKKLSAFIAEGGTFVSLLLDNQLPADGMKKIQVVAHRIKHKKTSEDLILLVLKDITEE